MRACLALEVADSQAAAKALAQLQGLAPERPEPQLLQRLLEQRTQFPEIGWTQAFLRAWTELGYPSFVRSPLLPELDPATLGFAPADGWKHAPSDALRLALVLDSPALSVESARWLTAQLPAVEDAAFVQAAAVALLSAELPPLLREEARSAVRQRLMQIAEASPQAMQPRLVLLWAEAPDESAFSDQEVERLEAIAALYQWKTTSFLQTFQEAQRRLKEAGLPYPGLGAYHVALWSNTHGVEAISRKRGPTIRVTAARLTR